MLGGGIGSPPGALLGGALGSVANISRPMPLDAAIRQALKQRNLALSSLTREAKNRLTCVFASGLEIRRCASMSARDGSRAC